MAKRSSGLTNWPPGSRLARIRASTPTQADTDALVARLRVFVEPPGPSGREDAVRAVLAERWSTRLDSLEIDRRGNLIGTLGDTGPRIALIAHMDEVGWVVRHITGDGFLLLDTAQGSRREGPGDRHPVGRDVVVLGRCGVVASGVLAAASGHVLTTHQRERTRLDWDDIWVDLGLSSRQEVEACGVHVGASVVVDGSVRRIGKRIVGKALDDRVALGVIDLLLERLARDRLNCQLVVAATVHEEGGLHGAHALAASHDFDSAIVLEIGLVGDIPSVGPEAFDARLGAGPMLVHKDGSIAYDHSLTWRLTDAGAKAGIPVQRAIFAGANTDGVPLLRAGIPTALVGIPTRYTHTAFELVDPFDIFATVGVLATLLEIE